MKAIHGRLAATAILAGAALALIPSAGRGQVPCAPGSSNSLYCQTIGRQSPATPLIRGAGVSADVCTARSARIRLALDVSAAGGVRSVTVRLDGHTIRRQRSGKLRLTIAASKLRLGVHTIKIIAVSRSGARSTRVMHFRICNPTRVPSFTG